MSLPAGNGITLSGRVAQPATADRGLRRGRAGSRTGPLGDRTGRVTLVWLILALLTAAVVALAMGSGSSGTPGFRAIVAGDLDSQGRMVVWAIRWPRVCLAFVVGAALGVSGLLLQTLLANPLADPYLIGVSGGAALGTVAVLQLGVGQPGVVVASAFVGGLLAMVAVMRIATAAGRLHRSLLVLAGVVVNAFLAASIALLLFLRQAEQGRLLAWLMGSLATPHITQTWGWLLVAMVVMAGAWVGAHPLNLLSLGDLGAHHAGMRVERGKWWTVVAASVLTAVAVSMSGMIGFVGMFVPHAARLLFGGDHRVLVPACIAIGGNLLLLTDTAARCWLPGAEVPVGVLTALLGAPFFLGLLVRRWRVIGT